MELTNLSLLNYLSIKGLTLYNCLISLLQNGKINKMAKKEFIRSLRYKNLLFYTQGALTQLFF